MSVSFRAWNHLVLLEEGGGRRSRS